MDGIVGFNGMMEILIAGFNAKIAALNERIAILEKNQGASSVPVSAPSVPVVSKAQVSGDPAEKKPSTDYPKIPWGTLRTRIADCFREGGNNPLTKEQLLAKLPGANRGTIYQYLSVYPEFCRVGDGRWKLVDECYHTGKMTIGLK